jgi:hypothetical protein
MDNLDDTYLRKNGRQCGIDGVIMASDHSIGDQRAMKKILSSMSVSCQSASKLTGWIGVRVYRLKYTVETTNARSTHPAIYFSLQTSEIYLQNAEREENAQTKLFRIRQP